MGACLRGCRARWWWPLLASILALVTIVGALTAAAVVLVEHSLAGVAREPDLLPSTPHRESVVEGRPVTMLLLGSDDRYDGGGGRSDAIMVVRISGDRREVGVISIPRDLYVTIPGHGQNKVNAALAFGGVPATVKTIEKLLKIQIDHVALIDMAGFVQLSGELGGVRVYNRHASHSGGYDFPVGPVTLDGPRALAYVRERKQLPRGDLDRTERQRAVLIAMARKVVSRDELTNPRSFRTFLKRAGNTMTLDDTLTVARVHELLLTLHRNRGGLDVASLEVPVRGFGTGPGGMSIDLVDERGLAALARALREDDLAGYRPPS